MEICRISAARFPVPSHVVEGLDDVLAFDGREALEPSRHRKLGRSLTVEEREVSLPNAVVTGKGGTMLDDVLELPNVAGPIVRAERVDRLGVDAELRSPVFASRAGRRKYMASSGTSSIRSRSGGTWMGMTASR